MKPDVVSNSNHFTGNIRAEFFAHFVKEFLELLFESEINPELVFFTLIDLTVVRVQNFFAWSCKAHFFVENFSLELLNLNFVRAWWDSFHEILYFFVKGFNMFVGKVALKAALEGIQAGFLWSWAEGEWFLGWGFSANNAWVFGKDRRSFWGFEVHVGFEAVVLQLIKVGKVKEGGSHFDFWV